MACLPPGGPTDIVFSFDTTGSMSLILDEVTGRLQDMIQRLQADIPGIRISIVAHGDYCDAEHFYVTKHMDFSDNIKELCDFVGEVGGTGGGDVAECYELVLRLVREQLSWQAMSQKVLIMIGDAYPHEPDYPENTLNIDWREEVDKLTSMGARVYGVQVGNDETSQMFFQKLSEDGDGQYVKLGDFSNICTYIMAICYRERGDDFLMGYEAEVRAGKGKKTMGKDLESLFGTLRRDDSKASSLGGPAALLVPPPGPVSPLPDEDPIVKTKRVREKSKSKLKVKKNLVASKKSSRTRKAKRVTTEQNRLRREKVPQSKFAYKDYTWSQWEPALVAACDTGHSTQWKDIQSGLGLKRKCINLFRNSKTRSHTFVEVSVQARPHTKRHVVMFKILNGSITPTTWFRAIFSRRKIRDEIQSVLSRGCQVFVRKAELKKSRLTVAEEVRDVVSLYDYAWQNTDCCHRDVYLEKYGVFISDSSV